ncbi:hypothetical protein MRX96_025266 [Rhipicephalus microplus]
MRSIQHMDNRVPPWDHSSISLVEDLPVAHMEAIHLRWAHPRPRHSNDHLLSRPLPAPHTRAARIQATRWPPRVVILQLPIRQLDHLAFQGPHLLEQQVLLLRQLLTLLQPLLLLAMHSTAKATHKAMVWLMAMGQVEVTPQGGAYLGAYSQGGTAAPLRYPAGYPGYSHYRAPQPAGQQAAAYGTYEQQGYPPGAYSQAQ